MLCEILVKFIDKFHQIEKNYKMLVAANVDKTKSSGNPLHIRQVAG